jgi:hypothetical protein
VGNTFLGCGAADGLFFFRVIPLTVTGSEEQTEAEYGVLQGFFHGGFLFLKNMSKVDKCLRVLRSSERDTKESLLQNSGKTLPQAQDDLDIQ